MEEQHLKEYHTVNRLLNKVIQKEFGDGIRFKLVRLDFLANRRGGTWLALTEKVYVFSRHSIDRDTLIRIERSLLTNLNIIYQMYARPNVKVTKVVMILKVR